MNAMEKHRLVATLFGLGYVPRAPGTVASLAAALVAAGAIALGRFVSGPGISALALLAASGWIWHIGRAAVFVYSRNLTPERKRDGRDSHFDHPIFVIDEALGMFLAALPLAWLDPGQGEFWACLFLSFVLFRVLDIAKPWPVSRYDRRDSAASVLADDAAAGLIASLPGWLYLLFF